MEAQKLEAGLVKWYGGYNSRTQKENKFGFIERTIQTEDLFVHEKNLLCSSNKLMEETVVLFEVEEDQKSGKNKAIKVREPDFNQSEELRICAENKYIQIWYPALLHLAEQLTTPDNDIVELLSEKIVDIRSNQHELAKLVERIPDQIFIDYENLIEFLPVERYIKISSAIYECSKDGVEKEKIIQNVSIQLENNRHNIRSFFNHWDELPSVEMGKTEWYADDYKEDTWDIIPFEMIRDKRIWKSVPEHKKYSILLKRINDSTEKEEYDQTFNTVVETAKNALNHETMPQGLKGDKRIFPYLNSIDQVNVGWSLINEYWELMNRDAKIRAVFKAAKENHHLGISDFLQTEKDLLVKSVLLLLGRKLGRPAPLGQIHNWLTEYITEAAWNSTEPLDLGPILPSCSVLSDVKYCEARRWPAEEGGWKSNNAGEEIAYCPRQHNSCVVNTVHSLCGAHVKGLPEISWDNWTLTDLFKDLGINPTSKSINRNDTYLLKIAGWVNRLNEIRERMKCEHCGKTLIPDTKYSFYPARYNSTVARCPDGHDNGIYFNHCSNHDCNHIIDSRESSLKFDRYYICIYCGDIPKYSRESFFDEDPFHISFPFTPGDMCPKCGEEDMLELEGNEEIKRCSNPACTHQIYLKGRKTKKKSKNRNNKPYPIQNVLRSLNAHAPSQRDAMQPKYQVVTSIDKTELPWSTAHSSNLTISQKNNFKNPPHHPTIGIKSKKNILEAANEIELDDLPW
ncbi:cold shock domain-containing protein [Rossellomorea marisflavi]|uniref:cold shock domain-containing protein n=1 Tax=Rossellomorea marisflavi TaxID=189381 RepID=UPI00351779B2